MKHYKSPANAIYAYELDGSQDHLIPADFVGLTDEELNSIRQAQYAEWLAAQPTKEQQIAKLQEQIDALRA
jgi:anti-sigma factor RsiW